jgi:GWxTD domain-containing protein
VLPVGLPKRLSAEELRVVLVHESLHLRHHDNLIANLSMLLRSSLWFHPLIWWLDHRLLVEREAARDEEALSLVSREAYVECLLKVCRAGSGLDAPFTAGMAASNLQKRIDLLMKAKITKQSQFARPAWTFAAAAGALIATVALVPTAVQGQRPTSPYTKWLDEDVVYIINPPEQAAYLALKTDAEREHFIGQFWQLRGTAAKEEHYRRIAYANERFGGQNVAGWRTPRGRIYITFGPPYQIEQHPARGTESWRYDSGPLAGATLVFDLNAEP